MRYRVLAGVLAFCVMGLVVDGSFYLTCKNPPPWMVPLLYVFAWGGWYTNQLGQKWHDEELGKK